MLVYNIDHELDEKSNGWVYGTKFESDAVSMADAIAAASRKWYEGREVTDTIISGVRTIGGEEAAFGDAAIKLVLIDGDEAFGKIMIQGWNIDEDKESSAFDNSPLEEISKKRAAIQGSRGGYQSRNEKSFRNGVRLTPVPAEYGKLVDLIASRDGGSKAGHIMQALERYATEQELVEAGIK